MDCFAFISKTKVSSRRNGEAQKGTDGDRSGRAQQRTFFLVLASKDGSGGSVISSFRAWQSIVASQCRGFASCNYRFCLIEPQLGMTDVENQRNRMRRPHFSLQAAYHDIGQGHVTLDLSGW